MYMHVHVHLQYMYMYIQLPVLGTADIEAVLVGGVRGGGTLTGD